MSVYGDGVLQKYIADHEAFWKLSVDRLETSGVGGTNGTHVGPGAIGRSFRQDDSGRKVRPSQGWRGCFLCGERK